MNSRACEGLKNPPHTAICFGALLAVSPLYAAMAQATAGETATPASTYVSPVSALPAITVTTESAPAASTTTLSKLPLTQREIPQSVNIISRELMDQQNIRTMEDGDKGHLPRQ